MNFLRPNFFSQLKFRLTNSSFLFLISTFSCAMLTGTEGFANLPSDPDMPLKHCYHWVKESSRKILAFKYNNAEKTGGEFSFYTDGSGGRAAGDGIYCSKTLVGSAEYGDRVIRLDFVEDVVFTNIDGRKVCPMEPNQAACNKRAEDVRYYNSANGWYVIRTPEVIESWTANDEILKSDLRAIQPFVDASLKAKFQSTIGLMEAEVQTKQKISYLNPKARMPFLKSIQTPEYLTRTASRFLIERLLKISEDELDSATRDGMIATVIKELARRESYDEFPALHQILSKKTELQNLLISTLQEQLKPELIAKFTPGTLVGIDALVPELISESDFQKVFDLAFKSGQDLDGLLKFAGQSIKAQSILSQIAFDSDIVAKLKTKESQISVLKILASRNTFESDKKSIVTLTSALAKQLEPQNFADLAAELGFLSETRTFDFISSLTNQKAAAFSTLPEKHLQSVLTSAFKTLTKKSFESVLTRLFEADADWISLAASLTESLPFSSMVGSVLPDPNKVFLNKSFSTTETEKLNLIAIRIAFLNPKLSARDLNMYKSIFANLVQGNACNGTPFELAKFETAKIQNLQFSNLVKDTFAALTNKKDSGLLTNSCNPIHYTHFLATFEGKAPAAIWPKLQNHFATLQFSGPDNFDFSTKINFKILAKSPNLEWRLIEKIVLHNLATCKASACDLSALINSYLNEYFKSRFDAATDDKTHSTSILISRVTYLLNQRGLPALAWLSFNQESLFYSSDRSEDYPMLTYLKLYSQPKAPADLKKKFDLLVPYSMDGRFLELLLRTSEPTEDAKSLNLQKAASTLLLEHLNALAHKKFVYFKENPNYAVTVKSRRDAWQKSRSNNFYCEYLNRNIYSRRAVLASRAKIEVADFQKSVLEILERDCK